MAESATAMSSQNNGSSSNWKAKLCLAFAELLLVPVALASLATWKFNQKEDPKFDYGQGDDDSPAAVFFGHFICYIFQLLAASTLFRKFLGANRQYRVYRQYMQEGGSSFDVQGAVVKYQITSHRSNLCIETRQTHLLAYKYMIRDEEDGSSAIYLKSKSKEYFCTCYEAQGLAKAVAGDGNTLNTDSLTPRTIPLKMLAGLPGSGYPAVLLEEELSNYWPQTQFMALFSVVAVIVLPYILLTVGDGDAWPVVALACAWSLGMGFYLAQKHLQSWEKETLYSGLQEGDETELPNFS